MGCTASSGGNHGVIHANKSPAMQKKDSRLPQDERKDSISSHSSERKHSESNEGPGGKHSPSASDHVDIQTNTDDKETPGNSPDQPENNSVPSNECENLEKIKDLNENDQGEAQCDSKNVEEKTVNETKYNVPEVNSEPCADEEVSPSADLDVEDGNRDAKNSEPEDHPIQSENQPQNETAEVVTFDVTKEDEADMSNKTEEKAEETNQQNDDAPVNQPETETMDVASVTDDGQ